MTILPCSADTHAVRLPGTIERLDASPGAQQLERFEPARDRIAMRDHRAQVDRSARHHRDRSPPRLRSPHPRVDPWSPRERTTRAAPPTSRRAPAIRPRPARRRGAAARAAESMAPQASNTTSAPSAGSSARDLLHPVARFRRTRSRIRARARAPRRPSSTASPVTTIEVTPRARAPKRDAQPDRPRPLDDRAVTGLEARLLHRVQPRGERLEHRGLLEVHRRRHEMSVADRRDRSTRRTRPPGRVGDAQRWKRPARHGPHRPQWPNGSSAT